MKQKKQTGLIGLYSGREIKASATKQSALTRTQTGKQALSAITAKYGQVVDNAKYFHKGKGEWHKYSLENDKKRTGSVTTDITAWRQRPNKLDFQGIDTKPEGSGTKRKAKTITQKVKPAMQKRILPISSLKNNNKLSGRSGKTAIKAVSKPALKTVEKPKRRLSSLKVHLQKKQLKPRTGKKQLTQKHVTVTKLSNTDSKAYMKNSPFTSREKQIYNSYSFYDVDINKEFNETVNRMEKTVQKEFPKGAPAEVLKALANYRKEVYESYLSESKARMTAPSMMVVGPAGYKNFDRKITRANAMRNKSYEGVKSAEKEIKLAIQRSNRKVEVNTVKTSYGVNVGDRVILYWTNNYRKFKVPAKVVTINVKSLIGELEEEVDGYYPKGHRITVPMYGTAGNKWSHVNQNTKAPETKKELTGKFYESLKGKFKIGDKVYSKIYRCDGEVIKISKQSMRIKCEPQYKGDDGLRKVPIDETMTIKK